MARRRDDEMELLVNGAGVLAAFWTALVSEVANLGGTAKDLHRLVTPEGMETIKRMASLIVGKETEVVSKAVQFVGDMITRVVPVDYTRTPNEAIKATRRAENTDYLVVKSMPARGDGVKEVKVKFFKACQSLSSYELAAEFEKHGIEPDPYAVAAVNEADPALADKYPNATQWKDEKGNWCFISFDRGGRERHVHVHRRADDWRSYWWFGGVCT